MLTSTYVESPLEDATLADIASPDTTPPDAADPHLATAQLRSRAMANISQAYAATHGHPLEHDTSSRSGLIWNLPLKTALAAITALAVITAIILGVQLANRPQSAPLLTLDNTPADSSPAQHLAPTPGPMSQPDPTSTLDPSTAAPATDLWVHVAGQVTNPQVVQLPAGARVIDAVEAAGGALAGADLDTVNLARQVQDGEQIYIPSPGESVPHSAGSAGVGDSGIGQSKVVGNPVLNLNWASQNELETLPGIGPALAGRIIEYREQTGGFSSVEQLRQVSGIGPKVFEKLKDLVTT